MRVSVLIPYRPDNERRQVRLIEGANRSQIFEFVAERWRWLLPDAEIVIGEPSGAVMNRSEARNRAFAASSGDVLVVADADTAVNPPQVADSMAHVASGARWVVGYHHYLQLTGPDTRVLLAQGPRTVIERPQRPRWSTDQGNAGLLFVTRDAWEAVRGYDERFVQWGWEDWAFANALETLVHPQVRVPGFIVHLCHPKSNNRSKKQGRRLFERYHHAHGDPEAMMALVSEPDRCG